MSVTRSVISFIFWEYFLFIYLFMFSKTYSSGPVGVQLPGLPFAKKKKKETFEPNCFLLPH